MAANAYVLLAFDDEDDAEDLVEFIRERQYITGGQPTVGVIESIRNARVVHGWKSVNDYHDGPTEVGL